MYCTYIHVCCFLFADIRCITRTHIMRYLYEDDEDEESPEEGLYFKFINSNSKNQE